MKIKSFYLYSKDFNTQKLYVLEIKKYFVNICELRKKKSSEKKFPINVIVRQLHAISFNVNYLHVIHDWLCTLRPLSSFHHVFARIDNKEYVISVHIWRRQNFCIPCIVVCKVAIVTLSLLFSRFHFMTMLKYVMHEVVYLRYRQKNSKMTEI